MPRVEEEPLDRLPMIRDGVEFTVGHSGCDLTWLDVEALLIWRERFNIHNHKITIAEIPMDLLNGILMVMRNFPGSHIETPDEVTYGVRELKPKPQPEWHRYRRDTERRKRR